jgi:hypothetical protein
MAAHAGLDQVVLSERVARLRDRDELDRAVTGEGSFEAAAVGLLAVQANAAARNGEAACL